MSRAILAIAVWIAIIWVAKLLGYRDQGVVAGPVVVLILQTVLVPSPQAPGRPRVVPRIDEGFMAGLLAGIMVSATLIRGYLSLASPGSIPLMRLTAEVASNFVPSVTVLAVVIAIADAWGNSVISKRTLLANEVIVSGVASALVGASTGAAIGWYFSRYENQRPFAPPELLLAGCVPAGIVIGLALAVRRGRHFDRPLMKALLVVLMMSAVLTAVVIVIADTLNLGYVMQHQATPAVGGALYGAVTGLAVGATAGMTLFLMRIWPGRPETAAATAAN
jgi:hypothetical protein